MDDLLAAMDKACVEKSILVGLWEANFMNCVTGGNDEVISAVQTHPDRLAGFAYLDPRETGCPAKVKQFAEEGFVGYKLFPPVGYRVDEERFEPVFGAIADTCLPVLIHCGQTNLDCADSPGTRAVNSALARPIYVDPLTRLYPHTTLYYCPHGIAVVSGIVDSCYG